MYNVILLDVEEKRTKQKTTYNFWRLGRSSK